MKQRIFVLVACLCLFAALTAVASDKSGQTKTFAQADARSRATYGEREPAVQVAWAFSDQERQVLRQYVQSPDVKGKGKARQLPPGLAKKLARGGKLPPGWQRKCAVGEIMPADVYEQCHALPPEVVVKMPPPPEPTLTVTIGGKVVRLLKATREILDVFDVNVRF